jgi:hypothetical protein
VAFRGLELCSRGETVVAYTTASAQQIARKRAVLPPLEALVAQMCSSTR